MSDNPNVIPRNPDGIYDGDLRVLVRYDVTDTTIYVGRATLGTATSASAWTIKRTILVAGNPTVTQWTSQTAVWDDRASATYT